MRCFPSPGETPQAAPPWWTAFQSIHPPHPNPTPPTSPAKRLWVWETKELGCFLPPWLPHQKKVSVIYCAQGETRGKRKRSSESLHSVLLIPNVPDQVGSIMLKPGEE